MTAAASPLPGTGGLAGELAALQAIWHRDMLHYSRDRVKIVVTLIQPVLMVAFLGGALATLLPASPGGADYRTFLFPGMLVMTVQAPAISAGASLVADRQMGFLRELIVAPVRRETLLVGRCLGGATIATCQGALLLPLAAIAGLPYKPAMLALLLAELAVVALAMTAFGVLLAVTISNAETFYAVMGILTTPIVFLSGAMFPVGGLPGWLASAVIVNPVSYAVDALRRTITAHLAVPASDPLFDGPRWGGWQPPVILELAGLALGGIIMLVWAARRFSRPD
ncbi:ABC transporter permease [Actinomadura livida]|uniref:Transport permease protein n=1 Tax=Actinomadura livida TaxID=79909 RepID=A0A7W7I7G9_9ACTN|nr:MULTISPECIES: ABC transporter permease [Actinomadura]MBB4771794.1 ABC-2 type transport system permease protein [Actinomadura catellatispora]GGU02536.1 daunorubicin ABC transporter permease [Actinomadura livida]